MVMMSWPGCATGACLCTAAGGRLLPGTVRAAGRDAPGALAG